VTFMGLAHGHEATVTVVACAGENANSNNVRGAI